MSEDLFENALAFELPQRRLAVTKRREVAQRPSMRGGRFGMLGFEARAVTRYAQTSPRRYLQTLALLVCVEGIKKFSSKNLSIRIHHDLKTPDASPSIGTNSR